MVVMTMTNESLPKIMHPSHSQLKSGPGGRSNLDRERQDFYTLNVVATDMPDGGSGQR